MQIKVYNTFQLNNVYNSLIEEKKSKFLGFALNVTSKSEVEDFLKKISNEHSKARHICYAYRVLENEQIFQKSSDDGEPSGVAGKPILNIIEKNDLYNVCIVVVRYFGGIKLGAGNLLRAYSNTAKLVINDNIISFVMKEICVIKISYVHYNELLSFFQKMNIQYELFLNEENVVIEVESEKKNDICKIVELHNLPCEIELKEKMQIL